MALLFKPWYSLSRCANVMTGIYKSVIGCVNIIHGDLFIYVYMLELHYKTYKQVIPKTLHSLHSQRYTPYMTVYGI